MASKFIIVSLIMSALVGALAFPTEDQYGQQFSRMLRRVRAAAPAPAAPVGPAGPAPGAAAPVEGDLKTESSYGYGYYPYSSYYHYPGYYSYAHSYPYYSYYGYGWPYYY